MAPWRLTSAGPWKTSSSEMKLKKTDFAGELWGETKSCHPGCRTAWREPGEEDPGGLDHSCIFKPTWAQQCRDNHCIIFFFSFKLVVQVLSPVQFLMLSMTLLYFVVLYQASIVFSWNKVKNIFIFLGIFNHGKMPRKLLITEKSKGMQSKTGAVRSNFTSSSPRGWRGWWLWCWPDCADSWVVEAPCPPLRPQFPPGWREQTPAHMWQEGHSDLDELGRCSGASMTTGTLEMMFISSKLNRYVVWPTGDPQHGGAQRETSISHRRNDMCFLVESSTAYKVVQTPRDPSRHSKVKKRREWETHISFHLLLW